MGRNHLRVLGDTDGAELVAVCDTDPNALESANKKSGTRGYSRVEAMIDREELELLVVAAPTRYHHSLTMAALDRGCNVLVEKPIAGDLKQAREMIALAASRGLILAVGHVERFNPAVRELKRMLNAGYLGRIFQVRALRLGSFPTRIRDVGVVIDLATHDLDVMSYLLNREVVRLYAETQKEIHTEHEDMLSALLKFDDGVIGVLEVNWLTPTKVREISVLGERGLLRVNYLTQELVFYENSAAAPAGASDSAVTGVKEGRITRFQIGQVEPLRAEIRSVLASVNAGHPVEVDGESGYRALALATSLVWAGEEGRQVEVENSLPLGVTL
jgi:predicted dehydrogenase